MCINKPRKDNFCLRSTNKLARLQPYQEFCPIAYRSSEAAALSRLTLEQDLTSPKLRDLQPTLLLQLSQGQCTHIPISLPQTDIKIHYVPRLKRLAILTAQH